MYVSLGLLLLGALVDFLSHPVVVGGVTLLIARMKRQFMLNMHKTGAIRIIGEDHFFSRLAHALAFAWIEIECDVCDNGKTCPYRTSVAKKQHEAREGDFDKNLEHAKALS